MTYNQTSDLNNQRVRFEDQDHANYDIASLERSFNEQFYMERGRQIIEHLAKQKRGN